jgi:hypothetical protein
VAVLELLDDLREQIVRNYAPQVQAYYRDNRSRHIRPTDPGSEIDDIPF